MALCLTIALLLQKATFAKTPVLIADRIPVKWPDYHALCAHSLQAESVRSWLPAKNRAIVITKPEDHAEDVEMAAALVGSAVNGDVGQTLSLDANNSPAVVESKEGGPTTEDTRPQG